VVAVANVVGTYYNGPANNGVGATLTIAASSLTIDSVLLLVGDRVLLTTQTSTYQNGIYVVKEIGATVILQRADDQQNIEQLKIGQLVTVGAGTVNAGSAFVLVAPIPQFIGIDAFLWASSPLSGALGTAGAKAATDNALSSVASTAGGGFVVGNFTMAADTLGSIEDSGIAASGLFTNALTDAHIFVGNAANVATDVAVTGDITISNTGVTAIGTGVIVNADINAAAAIAFSKLATLASTNILVGSAGGVATSVTVTGDVTIGNTGVTAIAAGAIVNADINAAAAIAFSKLATLASTNILVGSAGGVATSVAMTGDVTISNTGVTAIGATKVTLAMLAAGITPSHVIKFAGKEANGGGSATIAITVTGVLTTDVVFAQVEASTAAVSVQKVTPTADTITVLLSGDPGAATVISYEALRAAT
jgi:hypothetical protein